MCLPLDGGAQLATNASNAQQIISAAFYNDWAPLWQDGNIFDDDWESIAAAAAAGKLLPMSNSTGVVLSFINSTLPNSAKAQALYKNITGSILKHVTSAQACVEWCDKCRVLTTCLTATSRTSG